MKNHLSSNRIFPLVVVLSLIAGCTLQSAQLNSTSESEGDKDGLALKNYSTLLRSSLLKTDEQVMVRGTNRPLTFGAEKEGKSSIITLIGGPGEKLIKDLFFRYERELVGVFKLWRDGRQVSNEVRRLDGTDITLNPNGYRSGNDAADAKQWFTDAGDSWFAQLTPETRRKLFLASAKDFGGDRMGFQAQFLADLLRNFGRYVVLPGPAEQYIHSFANEGNGLWEIQFKPQLSLGKFEEMVDWFRSTFAQTDAAGEEVLYDSPGHIRLGMTLEPIESSKDPEAGLKKIGEVARLGQLWLMQSALAIQSDALVSPHLAPATDADFRPRQQEGKLVLDSRSTQRTLMRVEYSRFAHYGFNFPHLTLEMRTGLKDRTRRAVLLALMGSRLSSLDFDGISDSTDYDLFSDKANPENKCVQAGRSLPFLGANTDRFISFMTGFRYDKVPWLAEKHPFMTRLGNALEDACGRIDPNAPGSERTDSLKMLLQDAATVSSIRRDIEHKLRPVNGLPLKGIHKVKIAKNASDVNAVDLGIEFSARFPTETLVESTEERFLGRKDWLKTAFTLTEEARALFLYQFSRRLAKALGVHEDSPEADYDAEAAHGHGIKKAWTFKDAKGKKWRAEWDGIGRSYDGEGEIIEGSLRGGHIELVTPKFVPDPASIQKVFKVFDDLNIVPRRDMGGGHINIDLTDFECNPKALARFITLFHRNRDIIAHLFQAPNRIKSAEPLDIDPKLAARLANFNGTALDLKKMLYRYRYFNTRLGRKTRYVQLDLSAFFQDVIPRRFITNDFDINNVAKVPWRPQFRVNPLIRKAEMRMFNAPRNEIEAFLQIKLVRSMLNIAINSNEPLTADVRPVDFAALVNDPAATHTRFLEVMKELQLDASQYYNLFWEALAYNRGYVNMSYYRTPAEVFADFPQTENSLWRNPLKEGRTVNEGLFSEDRPFEKYGQDDDLTPMAMDRVEEFKRRYHEMEHLRGNSDSSCSIGLDPVKIQSRTRGLEEDFEE